MSPSPAHISKYVSHAHTRAHSIPRHLHTSKLVVFEKKQHNTKKKHSPARNIRSNRKKCQFKLFAGRRRLAVTLKLNNLHTVQMIMNPAHIPRGNTQTHAYIRTHTHPHTLTFARGHVSERARSRICPIYFHQPTPRMYYIKRWATHYTTPAAHIYNPPAHNDMKVSRVQNKHIHHKHTRARTPLACTCIHTHTP